MQLSIIFSLLAGAASFAAAGDVFSACKPEHDCCFSTLGACQRQSHFFIERHVECKLIDLCPDLGVSLQDCNADCCAISTKWGRGCPGK